MARCRCARGSVRAWLGLAVVLSALSGCGGNNRPKTYPVKGTVVFDRGDVTLLAGSSLLCQQQQDTSIQAQGDINQDGSFDLKTRDKGVILPGAIEGTYRAWLVFSSEHGDEEEQFRKTGIDPRYLSGAASDLTFKVPTSGELVLTIKRAKPGAPLILQDQ